MNLISREQVISWFKKKSAKLTNYKAGDGKKGIYYIISEEELIDLLLARPQFSQPINEHITVQMARHIVALCDEEDWQPIMIAKIAAETWPSLNIHTPTPVIGGMILRKSRNILLKHKKQLNNNNNN